MAFKLGKCRLCLKLGDFYSIFTADNNIQLAEMAMACSQIKVFEGDGLPDKVCVECIEKLSSAYVFKQQCERSDQELRRNYVPPPGFSEAPTPNRQSSDSGFSNRTELSSKAGSSASDEATPVPVKPAKPTKRARDNEKSLLEESYSVKTSIVDNKEKNSIKLTFNKEAPQKRARLNSAESDFDYAPSQAYSEDSDSQCTLPEERPSQAEPGKEIDKNKEKPKVQCVRCQKIFNNNVGLSNHSRTCLQVKEPKPMPTTHILPENYKSVLGAANVVVRIPPLELQPDIEGEFVSCPNCDKKFKLKIMLKRHMETCGSTPEVNRAIKTETVSKPDPKNSLEIPIEKEDLRNETCEYCLSKFKTVSNLEKHLKYAHGAVLNEADQKRKKIEMSKKRKSIATPVKQSDKVIVPVPCIFCRRKFTEYYSHAAHYHVCPKMTKLSLHSCTICSSHFGSKRAYFKHLTDKHFELNLNSESPSVSDEPPKENECRICNKSFDDQDSLVTHLAAHMSNIDEQDVPAANTSTNASPSHPQVSTPTNTSLLSTKEEVNCPHCQKSFKYRKSLATHIMVHHTQVNQETEQIKVEADLPIEHGTDDEGPYLDDDDDAMYGDKYEQKEDCLDNTCDICERQFSYKKALLIHKKRKHNAGSGLKRSKVDIKKCKVKCLICDFTTVVGEINIHNKMHIANNVHPKNLYTCSECTTTFASLEKLRQHMIYHRESVRGGMAMVMPSLADFCEVVVTPDASGAAAETPKADSPEDIGVSIGAGGNFLCPVCNKDMGNVASLRRHVNWHAHRGKAMSKDYPCEVCNETFKFKQHWRAHMSKHYVDPNLDPKFLVCKICNRKSKHLRAAKAHANWHKQTRFQGKDLQCSICKRIFSERKSYIFHMKTKHKNDSAAVIGTKDSTVLANNDNLEKNQCHICLKICDSENSLKCHLSWHNSSTSLFGSRYECQFCHVQFTNKRTHELHVRTHYEDENGPFKCTICGKGFTNDIVCNRHIKGHNFDSQMASNSKRQAYYKKLRESKVKCPICPRYYPDMVKLVRHLRRSHPESKMIKEDPDAPPAKLFYCKLCAKVFHSEYRLQIHSESHLRSHQWYVCKFCGIKSASKKRFNIHIKGHLTANYKDNPLPCPKCDEKFIKGYKLHWHLRDVHKINETWIGEAGSQPMHGPLKELQCGICYKFLSTKYLYSKHIDYHNSLRCNYCFEYFSRRNLLNGHLAFSCDKKKLLGETEVFPKKIKCYVCYKAYHVQIKLDCHLKIKHGIEVVEKNYKNNKESVCDYCFQVYENEDALASHKLYHRTIPTYGCKYCTKRFSTITGYNKHKKDHYACTTYFDDPFKCEHCDEKFPAFKDMITHLAEVHNQTGEWLVMPKEDKEEICNICNKKFFNLPKHLQYHEENRCKKCHEYFFSRNDYDEHLCSIESDNEEEQIDSEGKPTHQECSFCFKPLTKSNSKLKHDKIHQAAGFISCRFCPTKFKTMDAFKIHAFSHRSRNYRKKPLKCRHCNEHFIKYGPFVKHLRSEHNIRENNYYRCLIKPEKCVVCGDMFPNLMNHYRAHLQYRCNNCLKYFTSNKLFEKHSCDTEDSDPSKVFTYEPDLNELISSYVPKEEYYENKYYNDNEKEEDEVNGYEKTSQIDDESQNGDVDSQDGDNNSQKDGNNKISKTSQEAGPSKSRAPTSINLAEEHHGIVNIKEEIRVKEMANKSATAKKPIPPPVYDNYIDTHSPIISEVLSLAKEEMSVEEIMRQMQKRANQQQAQEDEVVEILENDDEILTSIIISDDDD